MRQQLWQIYYTLQSIGLVPPVVVFFFMARAAKTADDKKAITRWMLKKTLQFIGLFILITGILSYLEMVGAIDLLKAD